jgi:hypothetical protein
MAFLRDIKTKCDSPSCKSRPVVELVDRWNDVRGHYCRKCGAKLLIVQKSMETLAIRDLMAERRMS